MSLDNKMRLAPNGNSRSKEFLEKSMKIMERDRLLRKQKAEKLRAERQELYDSIYFERNYWIPIEKLDEFFTNPNFDIEYYNFNSYRLRDLRKKEISDYGYNLYHQWIDNFLHNNNQLYYRQVVYLDNYTNRQIIRDVLDNMKNKFGQESFDPFTAADYENGVDDTRLYDKDISDDYSDYDEDEYDSDA